MKVSLSQYRSLLETYLLPQWRKAALLAALLFAGIGLDLFIPQVLRGFIDTAADGGGLGTLTGLAAVYLGAALVNQAVLVANTYMATDIGLVATNRLRADLALHCLRLDPSFYSAHTPGELIERVDGDVGTLGNFFSRFVVQVLGSGLLMLGILIALAAVDWRVGAAMAVFSLIVLLALSRLRDVAVPHWRQAREVRAKLFGFVEERLAGTEDIRASGATAYVMRQLYQHARDLLRKQIRADLWGASAFGTTIVLFAVGSALSLGLAVALYGQGAVSLGTAYLIFHYAQLLTRPIESISRQVEDLQQAGASLLRINDLLNIRSAIADGEAGLPAGPLGVDFDNVVFSYTDSQAPDGHGRRERVLNEVSFALAPGKVLGLLGRTGSGKTTLTRLLFRLYDPAQGRVRLANGTGDRVDVRAARLAELRRRVGMVTQDIQLFNASVRDNVTFFDRGIADDRIEAALRALGLWDWVQGLPQGLDTRLASGGGGLSAGEAQLLAFARVFLKDPGLVVLDEASSRLDPATEQRLEQAISRLLAGRTGIIIAHRLATVQRADEIIIMEDGRIREHGPREQLALDPDSRFAELLRAGLEDVLA